MLLIVSRCPQHLEPRIALHRADAAIDLHEIRLALRVEVAHRLGQAQRELALLTPLALVDQRPHATQHVGARGVRRSSPAFAALAGCRAPCGLRSWRSAVADPTRRRCSSAVSSARHGALPRTIWLGDRRDRRARPSASGHGGRWRRSARPGWPRRRDAEHQRGRRDLRPRRDRPRAPPRPVAPLAVGRLPCSNAKGRAGSGGAHRPSDVAHTVERGDLRATLRARRQVRVERRARSRRRRHRTDTTRSPASRSPEYRQVISVIPMLVPLVASSRRSTVSP